MFRSMIDHKSPLLVLREGFEKRLFRRFGYANDGGRVIFNDVFVNTSVLYFELLRSGHMRLQEIQIVDSENFGKSIGGGNAKARPMIKIGSGQPETPTGPFKAKRNRGVVGEPFFL